MNNIKLQKELETAIGKLYHIIKLSLIKFV